MPNVAKISSWTKAEYQSLSASTVISLSPTQIGQMAHPEWLLPSAISALSPTQVPSIISSAWSIFDAAWLNALSAKAFAAIPVSRISSLSFTTLSGLNAAHVGALTSAQLGEVSESRWGRLSGAWINSISLSVMPKLSSTFAVSNWSSSATAVLDVAHVKAMTPEQIGALDSPESLSPAAIGALSAAQVAAISDYNYQYLTPAWFNALSTSTFGALSVGRIYDIGKDNLWALDAAHIGALSAAQLAQQSDYFWYYTDAKWLNSLSPSTLGQLPTSAVKWLDSAAIAGLDTAHLGALTATQFAALGSPKSVLRALTPAQIGALGTGILAALTQEQVKVLTAAQVGGLTGAQISALSSTQIGWLSSPQVAGLGAQAVTGLRASQLDALGTNLHGLSPAAFAALPAERLAGLTNLQLSTLTAAQFAALDAQQLGALSASQVKVLTPGQLDGLRNHVQWLSPVAVTGLNATMLTELAADFSATQLAALSSTQRAVVQKAKDETTALLNNLSVSGIRTQVSAALQSGESLFSYNGLLKVLQDVNASMGSSTLTSAQFNDLKALTASVGKVLGTDSYLYGITNAVINGSAGNATWTGGTAMHNALGNLDVGRSAYTFDKLIDKWFLGQDLPTWTDSTAYSRVDLPLYSKNGPDDAEISQAEVGNCYMLASLVNIADDDPELIESMITDNGNGTYGVRMYGLKDELLYVTVNDELPGAGTAGTGVSTSGAYWVSVLEKAFVSYTSMVRGDANAYASIEGGNDEAIQAFTGRHMDTYNVARDDPADPVATKKAMVAALTTDDEDVLYASYTIRNSSDGKRELVSGHMYSILGYSSSADTFTVRNPWGSTGGSSWIGTFDLTFDQLWRDRSYVLITDEDAPAGAVDWDRYPMSSAADQLVQAMATLDSGSASAALMAAPTAMDPRTVMLAIPG